MYFCFGLIISKCHLERYESKFYIHDPLYLCSMEFLFFSFHLKWSLMFSSILGLPILWALSDSVVSFGLYFGRQWFTKHIKGIIVLKMQKKKGFIN